MVEYRATCDGVTAEMLGDGFFDGWPSPPDADTHLRLLRHSDLVELALHDGTVVGFATAITDGVLTAFVPLLEVLPSHQHQGIGTELMHRLLARLSDVYAVDAVCDDDLVAFYQRLGLQRLAAVGRRNYAAQDGRPPSQ